MLLKGVCSGSAAGVRAISSSTSSGLVSCPDLPDHGKVKDLGCLYNIIHIVASTLHDVEKVFSLPIGSFPGRMTRAKTEDHSSTEISSLACTCNQVSTRYLTL